jgi:rod shape-determining protein MreB
VDLGGGTSEIAVISLGGIVCSKSIRIGGDELDDAIIHYLKIKYNVLIGERTAEDVKIKIGSAFPLAQEMNMEIRGRDLVTGLPRTLNVTSQEIREALAEIVSIIVNALKETIGVTPPELSADIIEKGITLAGGTSQLRGFTEYIHDKTGLPVRIAEEPQTCVVKGAGNLLTENITTLKKYSI